jgi:hypothetical protein
LKNYISPGIGQIPAELTQAGSEALQSKVHKLINSIRNEEQLLDKWKEPIITQIYKKGDKTD